MTISTIGLILALATALAVTLKDRKIKKLKDVKLSSYSSALFMFLAALPIITAATAIAIFLKGELPILGQNFWIALAINSPLMVFANYFYIKAYRGKENFSAIATLNSITPIGTIIIAFIV
ncbi:hypothetical protein K8R32_03720, partial [bacterium]|nr:hypothetical protein [bacterium]